MGIFKNRSRTHKDGPAEYKDDLYLEDSFEKLKPSPPRTVNILGKMVELGTIGALTLSVVSSVSIVVCNKFLISGLGFHFATTLTCGHLAVTGLFLHIAKLLRWFEPKTLEFKPLIIFSVLNGISIGFLNLSLGFNSVGFYQMTKLAIIPCTVFLQTIFYAKRFSFSVKSSLFILLLGVGVATVTDLQLNFMGSMLSLCAIVTTCVSQIWTNTMQKRYNVGSTPLLYLSAPYQALTLLILGPPLDQLLTHQTVLEFEYTPTVYAFIALSCMIAISVNFSTFLVIGKCDAVTYQVLGHVKTMLVLAFGFVVLQNPASMRNLGGILIAVIGMIAYAHYNEKDSQMAQTKPPEDPAKDIEDGTKTGKTEVLTARK